LQAQNQKYHGLEKTKDQLRAEAADVIVQQAVTKSTLKEECLSLDKQAEELMGVDDVASDKLFDQKLKVEEELKSLDAVFEAVNDAFAKKLNDCRLQIDDLQKQSRAILYSVREELDRTITHFYPCPCKPLRNRGK